MEKRMGRKYVFLFVLLASLFAGTTQVYGQSVKKMAKSTVGLFTGLDFIGKWHYEGVAVKFETKNLLKKAGGKAAASKMEKDLNSKLDKMGFVPGVTVFYFEKDGTFYNETNGVKVKGKYEYDSKSKYITLKYMNHIPIKAKVSGTGSKASLLFEAKGFLSMVTFIGSHSGVSIIKGVSSLLNSYDGMLVGMELKKE